MPKHSETDEEATVETGAFNVTSRRGQKLPATQPNPYVAPEIRVLLKILSNAIVAPRWIELVRIAERCKEHNLHRLGLESPIASAQHAVNSFNAITPKGVRQKRVLGSQLLKTFDRTWPWHALTPLQQ